MSRAEEGFRGGWPETGALERWLCERVAALAALPVDAVEVRKPFTYYGLTSLDAVGLTAELEDWLGVPVPATLAWDYPTVVAAARYLAEIGPGGAAPTPAGQEPTPRDDLTDPLGAIAPLPPRAEGEPREVLLTGATGFLGAHLLRELLLRTRARIHCLVRGGDEQEAARRLREGLERYGLWEPRLAGRVVALPGDLAAPRLGLSDATWEGLSERLDSIYHGGAAVSYVRPYAALRAANVLGTGEVLRLAAGGVAVHFVSTLGVFYATRTAAAAVVREDDPPAAWETLYVGRGYAQSKWAAEGLVAAARARGLAVTLYRPALLAGHRRTGAWNADDLLCRLLRGCIALGAAPDLDLDLDLVPVDWAARGIVALSLHADASGRAYHLNSYRPVHWSDLLAWTATAGYPLHCLPYPQWQAALLEAARQPGANPLTPLAPFFTEPVETGDLTTPELYARTPQPRFASLATRAALSHLGIGAPRVDAALLNRCLRRLEAAELLGAGVENSRQYLAKQSPGARRHEGAAYSGRASGETGSRPAGQRVTRS